jgi:hypothetical protein
MSNFTFNMVEQKEEILVRKLVSKSVVEISAQQIKDLIKEKLLENGVEVKSIDFSFRDVEDPNSGWGYNGEMGPGPTYTQLVKATVICAAQS